MFIPVVWAWNSDQNRNMLVPSLGETLGLTEADLPKLIVFSPLSDKVMVYPEEAFTIEQVSPELIWLWARRDTLAHEIQAFQAKLDDMEKEGEEGVAE